MKSIRKLILVSFSLLLLFATGCKKSEPGGETQSGGGKQITVALMPKSKGNA
jgi:hypothetical protein